MALIKRSTKGSALTYAELDGNFTHLGGDGSYVFPATDGTANYILKTDGNGQISWAAPSAGGGIALTDLSVGSNASASGTGGIGYNNTTGVFTYTPPDLSSYLTSVAFSAITSTPTTIAGYGITDALALGTSSTTALAGDTALLQLGTTSTTALAGDTALLQLGTSSTTALAGDTALLQLGTSSTTALAGNTTFALQDLSNVSISSPASTQVLRYNGTNWINSSDNSIGLTSLSVTTASATSSGSLAYNNASGVFTFTPPELAFSNLSGNVDLASQVSGTLPVANMAATALTTVQTAANETAHLALTAQEGDVVVRSDQSKTYMHNGGSAGNMTDYTLLATPTDSVTSVDGNTGAVTTLQLGTTSTTALAGNTSLLQLGTTSTTALAGDTALLALGTSSTTALAGDTTFSTLANSSTATDTIAIGSTTQTGIIALGQSTDTHTVNIANGATAASKLNNVNIACNSSSGGTKNVNIASLNVSGVTTNINMGNQSTSATSNITITGNTIIRNALSSNTIAIGGTSQTGAITLGQSTTTQTINIANGSNSGGTTNTVNVATTGSTGSTQTINLARMSATGITTNVNIGNTSSSATSNIDLTGNVTLNAVLSSNTQTIGGTTQTGTITIGRSTQTQTIDIAAGDTAGSRTTTVKIANTGDSGSTRAVKIASNSDATTTVNVDIGNPNTSATSNLTLNGKILGTSRGDLKTEVSNLTWEQYEPVGGTSTSLTLSTSYNTTYQTFEIPATEGNYAKARSFKFTTSFNASKGSSNLGQTLYTRTSLQAPGKATSSFQLGDAIHVSDSGSGYSVRQIFKIAGDVTQYLGRMSNAQGGGISKSSTGAAVNGESTSVWDIESYWYDATSNATHFNVGRYPTRFAPSDGTAQTVYYDPFDWVADDTWVVIEESKQYSYLAGYGTSHNMSNSFPLHWGDYAVNGRIQFRKSSTSGSAFVYNFSAQITSVPTLSTPT